MFRSSSTTIAPPNSAAAVTEDAVVNDVFHPPLVSSLSMDHGLSEGQEKAKHKLPTATASEALLVSQLQLKQEQEEDEDEKDDEEEVIIVVCSFHDIITITTTHLVHFITSFNISILLLVAVVYYILAIAVYV